MDSCFWLAETVAIWSFGTCRGGSALGIALSLLFRPRYLTRIALGLLFAAMVNPALAARHHRSGAVPSHRGMVRMPASPTDPDKDAALIVDGATGKVLYARN